MAYFTVNPDFKVLRPYLGTLSDYHFETLVKEFATWNNAVASSCFYKEQDVTDIINGFERLMAEYKLSDHYDNILYLSLHFREAIENEYLNMHKLQASKKFMADRKYSNQLEYGQLRRAKELAELILLLKPDTANCQIKFSSTNTNAYVKIQDQKLSKWICELILKEVESNPSNLSILGEDFMSLLKLSGSGGLDMETIQHASALVIKEPSNQVIESRTKFCLALLPYLNNETHLKASEGVKYGNPQLDFLYKLLILMELIGQGEHKINFADYYPSDYLRTILP